MERIPHRELRSNSSQILREVAAGATYEITNNGEVVAILAPPVATTLRIRPATRHGGWTEITPIKAEAVPTPEVLDEHREPRVLSSTSTPRQLSASSSSTPRPGPCSSTSTRCRSTPRSSPVS